MDLLSAMRTFAEIATRGSMTAAAHASDRSLPAVTRQLAQLEQHLGVRLLQRTTRTQSLTPEGATFLRRCERIVAEVEDAERELLDVGTTLRGPLAVAAPVLFGQRHVMPILGTFLKDHPQVNIDLSLLDRVVHFSDEPFDLAVRIGPLTDSSLIAVPVGTMRRIVCAAPALLARCGRPERPDDLHSRPCLRAGPLAPGWRWHFQQDGRDIAVAIDGPLACNQVAAAADACRDGVGFGQFLAYQVEPFLRDATLQVVLNDFESPAVPVHLLCPTKQHMPRRVRAVLDTLRAHLRQRLTALAAAVDACG